MQFPLEIVFKGPIDKHITIVSGNGLAPNARTTGWDNVYSVHRYIYESPRLSQLITAQWASCQIREIAGCAGIPGTFSPPLRISDPDMHHGTCVTHVPWCMTGSLTSGFLWSRWRGKSSRHSRRTRKPRFYISGKVPINGVPWKLNRSNISSSYRSLAILSAPLSKTHLGEPVVWNVPGALD